MNARAETDAQKREVVEQILRAWRRVPAMRLGQLLWGAELTAVGDLFNVEDYELVQRVERQARWSAGTPEIPELAANEVFYFGCWDERKWHLTYRTNGRTARHDELAVMPKAFRNPDEVFCGSPALGRCRWKGEKMEWCSTPEAQPQNRGRIVCVEGWTVLAFWDRTADQRFGSNAAFIAKGELSFDQMCEVARRHFPSVWARVTKNQPMLQAVG